jgi:hypothetical protein
VQVLPQPHPPEAEISVYVEANTLILSDLAPLIAEFAASSTPARLALLQITTLPAASTPATLQEFAPRSIPMSDTSMDPLLTRRCVEAIPLR